MTKKLFLVLALMISPSLCFAQASPELMKEVDSQVTSLQNEMNRTSSDTGVITDSLIFRNIWLRLQIPIGFSVMGLAGFSVVPEFEMLVQRPLPDGWSVYNPQQKAAVVEEK